MKFTTAFTLIVCTALVCFTVLGLDYIRYSAELEMRSKPTPILQIIPLPGSDDEVPNEPGVWRERHHRGNT